MELTIRADSFSELKKKINHINMEINGVMPPPSMPVQLEFPIEMPSETPPKVTAKKQTKKSTEVVVEDSIEAQVSVNETPVMKEKVSAEKEITRADVGKALQLVFDKHGLAEAQKLLKPFKAKALREVKAEDFEAVIAACKKSVKE